MVKQTQNVIDFFNYTIKIKTKPTEKGITLINHNTNVGTRVLQILQFIVLNSFLALPILQIKLVCSN